MHPEVSRRAHARSTRTGDFREPVTLGRQLTREWSLSGTLRLESVDIDNPDVPTPDLLQAALGETWFTSGRVALVHDTRDNAFLPTEGHFLQASFFTVVFSILGAWFYLDLFSWKLLALTAVPALVSLFYPLSFQNPMRSFTSLRTVPGLKVLLIAGSWAYVTYLVPVIYHDIPFFTDWMEFGMRSLFIIALIIPFDIRDMQMDDHNMRTIPQIIGERRGRLLALGLVSLYGLWKIFLIGFGFMDVPEGIAWLCGIVYSGFLIARMDQKRSELYCGFWIEGTPILVALLLLIHLLG